MLREKKTRKKSALLYNSGFIQKRPESEIRNVQVLYNLLKNPELKQNLRMEKLWIFFFSLRLLRWMNWFCF